MFRKSILLLLLLATSPAMADDTVSETVYVHASPLAGFWRVSFPQYAATDGLFSPLKWGPMQDTFCRVSPSGDDLEMTCARAPHAGPVTVKDSHIHIAWGSMLAWLVVDGDLQSPASFEGRFQAKLAGVVLEAPERTQGSKLTLDPEMPDASGKAALVRRILEDGLAEVPHDAGAARTAHAGAPETSSLGPIEAVAYLGQELDLGIAHRVPDAKKEFSIFAVTYQTGSRLCSLHQHDDGVVDSFGCF